MSEKFKNKYRTESFRAKWWNYSWNAAYFVTICTLNRHHYFGKISNGKMILSGAGVLADVFWHEIKNHQKYVELDAFVVMPNHIHGILIINKPHNEMEKEKDDKIGNQDDGKKENENKDGRNGENGNQENKKEDFRYQEDGKEDFRYQDDKKEDFSTVVACNDSTAEYLRDEDPLNGSEFSQHMADISPKKDSLPSILRSYKSAVTKHANRLGFEFDWQSKYHDHIIRDEAAYQRIAQYILNNPSKWKEDGFY